MLSLVGDEARVGHYASACLKTAYGAALRHCGLKETANYIKRRHRLQLATVYELRTGGDM